MTREERIHAAAIIASGFKNAMLPKDRAAEAVETLGEIEKLIPHSHQPIHLMKEMDTFYPEQ